MSDDVDAKYIADNRLDAERLMILLAGPRLLWERHWREDFEHCRLSAQDLRRALEAQMIALDQGGFLEDMLSDLRRACAAFVTAAGANAANFVRDPTLFQFQLDTLRLTFARRVRRIVDAFGLAPTQEIQDIIGFRA
jgi:hypothetical protein